MQLSYPSFSISFSKCFRNSPSRRKSLPIIDIPWSDHMWNQVCENAKSHCNESVVCSQVFILKPQPLKYFYFVSFFFFHNVNFSTICFSPLSSPWWSGGKNHQGSLWPKRFFVKLSEARTVTMEPLIAVFAPVNKLQFELLPNCILFFKLKLQRKQNN